MTLPNGTYMNTCGLRFVWHSRYETDEGTKTEVWVLGTNEKASPSKGLCLKYRRGKYGHCSWVGVLDNVQTKKAFCRNFQVIQYLRRDLEAKGYLKPKPEPKNVLNLNSIQRRLNSVDVLQDQAKRYSDFVESSASDIRYLLSEVKRLRLQNKRLTNLAAP